jgi:UDP:flavonoid glycosyltransferase YjiC (YdhE family)
MDFLPLDSPDQMDSFFQDGELLNSPRGIAEFYRRHLGPATLRDYRLLTDWAEGCDGAVVARHMSTLADSLLVVQTGLPVVRVFTAISQVSTLPMVSELCRTMLADDINSVRADAGLAPVTNWLEWLRYARLSLGTWPSWFGEPDPMWLVRPVPVGFLKHDPAETGELPAKLRERIEAGFKPVVISGGTGIFLGMKFYEAAALGCALAGLDAVLVTAFDHLVPRPLPLGITWYRWLPFASLLPHALAVIHHGGASTLARAIASGVPQLVLPFGADRPDNAARLKLAGVAEVLLPPQWSPQSIANVLLSLINSETVLARCLTLRENERHNVAASKACDEIAHALSWSDS